MNFGSIPISQLSLCWFNEIDATFINFGSFGSKPVSQSQLSLCQFSETDTPFMNFGSLGLKPVSELSLCQFTETFIF